METQTEPHRNFIAPQQLAAISDLAQLVKSNYASMDIAEILNRIHYITGKDYARVIAGFKMMFQHNLISSEFVINAHKLPSIEKAIDKIFPLIVAIDGEITKVEAIPENGPTDEADEEIITHLTADF